MNIKIKFFDGNFREFKDSNSSTENKKYSFSVDHGGVFVVVASLYKKKMSDREYEYEGVCRYYYPSHTVEFVETSST